MISWASLLAPVTRFPEPLLKISVPEVLAREAEPFRGVRSGGASSVVDPAGLQTRSGNDSLEKLVGRDLWGHGGI
jgi:hypothetical protein